MASWAVQPLADFIASAGAAPNTAWRAASACCCAALSQ